MVKAKKNISRNQIQHFVYALITVFITVHAFVFYSLYVIEGDSLMQVTGTTSVWRAIDCQGGVYMFGDYLPVWLMIIIEIAFAFVLAVTMGSPLAFRLAISCKKIYSFCPKECICSIKPFYRPLLFIDSQVEASEDGLGAEVEHSIHLARHRESALLAASQ